MKNFLGLFRKDHQKLPEKKMKNEESPAAAATINRNIKQTASAEKPVCNSISEADRRLLEELCDTLIRTMSQEVERFDKLTRTFFASEESRKPHAASAFLNANWDIRRMRCLDVIQNYVSRMDERLQSSWQRICQARHLFKPEEPEIFYFVFEEDDASKNIIKDSCKKLHSNYDKWWKCIMQEGAQRWKPIRILDGVFGELINTCLGYDEEFEVFVSIEYLDKYGPNQFVYYFSVLSPEQVEKKYHGRFRNYPAKIPSRAVKAYYTETERSYCTETDKAFLHYIYMRIKQDNSFCANTDK